MKTYIFKVVLEKSSDMVIVSPELSVSVTVWAWLIIFSFHHSAKTFPPKTLKRIIEEQAGWTEADLRRLKLLKQENRK